MKLQTTLLSLFIILAFNSPCSAQQTRDFLREPDINRPLLFASVTSELPVPVSTLEQLFSAEESKNAGIVLPSSFTYTGLVQSVTVKNENTVSTIIIKSSNRDGSFLTLSRILLEDGSVKFIGRILSFQHGDCLVLQQKKDFSYAFVKKKLYDMVGE